MGRSLEPEIRRARDNPSFRCRLRTHRAPPRPLPHIMTFTVTLHPAERAFDVARDETILSAAIRAGVGMPYGCRDGACGSCKSRLQATAA